MPEVYSATVMVLLSVGSNAEPPELNGISHFIEHMLFKGTQNRTSEHIVQSIERMGGSINAFTEKESTCYYTKVLSNQVSVALDVLVDMVFNSVYEKKNLEIERQVILEEIKMYEDTPDDLVHDLLVKSFWKGHSLSYPITGSIESISRITRNDVINFVENFYTSENIIISIAGNFDENEVMAQLNGVKCNTGKVQLGREEIPLINPDISICNKDIEQSHICIGMRGVSILDKKRYASTILDVCLGGGMSSRLFQEIREKRGLVYSINSYEALYRSAGIFGVYASTGSANVNDVIELIMEETEKLKLKGLSKKEFEQAKIQLKGNLLIGSESTKNRAGKNGRAELYLNQILTIEEICDSIDKVTIDDINMVSSYIFDNKYMGISLVCPKEFSSKKLSLLC
jgi:predicted Zn-dependent peptidase